MMRIARHDENSKIDDDEKQQSKENAEYPLGRSVKCFLSADLLRDVYQSARKKAAGAVAGRILVL